MSRIGKLPISIPAGVTVTLKDDVVTVKGPKGELSQYVNPAIKVAIDEALKCKETGEEKTIKFGLTGPGYFDMYAYEKFNDGKMENYTLTDEEIAASIAKLPKVPGLN